MAASSRVNLERTRRRLADEGGQRINDVRAALKGGNSGLQSAAQLLACLGAGVVFGFMLEKGRVFEPQVIRDQMSFQRFIMLKMFLSATASGMFCFSLLSMISSTQTKFQAACNAFAVPFYNKGFFSSMTGAAILGAGMTLSGACPGMVLAQVGAGTEHSVYTLLGALSGALLYGILEPALVAITKPSKPLSPKQQFLHRIFQSSYSNLALPFASLLGLVVFAVELYSPWKSELQVANTDAGLFNLRSWPPFVTGAVIGLLQIPIILSVEDTMGGSSSYCTVVSQMLIAPPLKKLSPYLTRFRSGIDNWWQVLYVSGAVLGAFLSSSTSSSFGEISGVDPLPAFAGGAMMIFGARLAAGCTSGHGLSGMGLLSVLSLIAVPSMFGGGMLTSFIMNKI